MCRKLIVSMAGEAYDARSRSECHAQIKGSFRLFILCLSMTPVRPAQDKEDNEDKTVFLVARPGLPDPIFKESVVLRFPAAVRVGEGLVVGLILNKPGRVALNDIFPNDKALENRSETAYFGGPVDPRVPGVVFRSSKAAKQAALLFGDIYVSFDPDFIKELVKNPKRDGHGSVVQRPGRNEPDIQC
jgi:putative AlgH/UPF0301 family transcriptional regulator